MSIPAWGNTIEDILEEGYKKSYTVRFLGDYVYLCDKDGKVVKTVELKVGNVSH